MKERRDGNFNPNDVQNLISADSKSAGSQLVGVGFFFLLQLLLMLKAKRITFFFFFFFS